MIIAPIGLHFLIYSTPFTDIWYPANFELGVVMLGVYGVLILIIYILTKVNHWLVRDRYQPRTVVMSL
jgi:hypothetical protein